MPPKFQSARIPRTRRIDESDDEDIWSFNIERGKGFSIEYEESESRVVEADASARLNHPDLHRIQNDSSSGDEPLVGHRREQRQRPNTRRQTQISQQPKSQEPEVDFVVDVYPSPSQQHLENEEPSWSRTPNTRSTVFSGTSKANRPRLRQLTSKSMLATPGSSLNDKVKTSASKRKHSLTASYNPPETAADSDENVTASQLESTIIVESSPIQAKKKQKRKYRRSTPVPVPVTPPPPPIPVFQNPVDTDYILPLSSQPHENLNSELILEVASQGPCFATPVAAGGTTEVLKDAIEIDAASQDVDDISPREEETTSEEANSANSAEESKSLLERFKSIRTKYESSVRLFGHNFRNGKYKEVVSTDLVIRRVVERHDKSVKALAYDLVQKKDKLILFKPADSFEIKDGVCLKLYKPWQEISVEGSDERIIIGADFYKIFRNSDFDLDADQINDILNMDFPRPTLPRACEPLFMDLVPYHIRNTKSVERQVFNGKSYVDIDIVVLSVWRFSNPASPVVCLIKDSDDFLTFLEIPRKQGGLLAEILPGKYFELSSVAINKKIRIFENLAPFSVIRLFGGKQTYYFNLKYEDVSKWESRMQLDILLDQPRENFLNMEEIDMASTFLDCRITLKCILKEMDRGHVLVRDLDSDRSLMINLVLEKDFCIDDIQLEINERIILKFLRLIHGKAIWDRFTTCEELDEEEDCV